MSALRWVGSRLATAWREKALFTVSLAAFWALAWYLIPRHLLIEPRRLPLGGLEEVVPFLEDAVWMYLSIGLFNVVGPYLTTDRALLRRHAVGFAALTATAFVVFTVFPVQGPAPVARPTTVLYGLVLADTRLNCFPSLHAAYAVYGVLYWRHVLPDLSSRRARGIGAVAMVSWALALGASVLLLHQHWIADLAAGATLGAGVYGIVVSRRSSVGAQFLPSTPLTEIRP